MTAPDLGIVIVSYNVSALLQRCLDSIDRSLAGSALRSTVVVIDNASDDDTVAMVRSRFPNVVLIANTTNRGFAGGVNDGLARLGAVRGASAEMMPRAVFVLNPDTEIVGDALSQMVAYLDTHPTTAVVGPLLRYADGSLQSSRRRFPSVAMFFWEGTVLEHWWQGNPWARRYRMEDRDHDHAQSVDWLVGAALMVRGTAIARAGGLDEGFFMYSEELEWQERVTRTWPAPHPIVYLPDATVMHYEGRSSEQNLLRRHLNFQRSKLRYAHMRFGAGVYWALRVFLLLSYALQTVVEMVKWMLGHKRALRARRVAEYVQIMRSGL